MAWRWEDEVQVASQGQLVVKSSPLFGRFYVANSAIPVSAVVLRDADPLLLSKTESSSTLLDNFETESSPVLTDLFSRAYCPESISLAAVLLRHSVRGVDAPASATSDSDAALRSYVSVRRSTVDLLDIIAFLCARDGAWAEQERHCAVCAAHTTLSRTARYQSIAAAAAAAAASAAHGLRSGGVAAVPGAAHHGVRAMCSDCAVRASSVALVGGV